ncbi:MAG: OmpA family protein [Chitinophagaceae bacterium]|nr:OmpA family protein [Chitinophagaceae bacterium]
MKKIYLLLSVNLLIFNIIYAQVKFGLGGGVHNSTVIEKNSLPNWKQQFGNYYTPYSGFHAGLFSEFALDKKANWAVQASLLYTTKGRNFARSYDSAKSFHSDTSSIISSWKLGYLELPVHLVYRIPLTSRVRFILGAGGYAGYNLTQKASYQYYNASGELTTYDNKLATGDNVHQYNKLDYGMNALAGFDFNDRIMLTANYNRSLSDFYKAEYSGSFRHQSYGATLVVWVTKSKSAKLKADAKDSDGDGVPDKIDKCNGENGTAATGGCPDTDGDGIPDMQDKCPDVAGISKLLGCPAPDKDNDGVSDEEDKCPDVAGSPRYDGCPVPDTDNDGINDEEDECPAIIGSSKYKGCPAPDTDMDGVNDDEDKCPLKPGKKEQNGCPDIEKDMIDNINKAARSILFDVNSDNIKSTSNASLDRIADILINNPEIKLDIEGHTDNTGAVRHNQILSGKRALAIKMYLVKKGVEPERLTASGFGSEHPIADNNTEAGRAKNRRVAFKVRY